VNALETFGDYCAHAQQQHAFAAQSRDEPEPYSFPAMISSGTPSF